MNQNRKLFTSESVTEGHPDKVCDKISDAVLDDILAHDPNARVACECCVATGLVHLALLRHPLNCKKYYPRNRIYRPRNGFPL